MNCKVSRITQAYYVLSCHIHIIYSVHWPSNAADQARYHVLNCLHAVELSSRLDTKDAEFGILLCFAFLHLFSDISAR